MEKKLKMCDLIDLKSSLEKHMVQHNGKTLHLCNFCGKMFPTDAAMRAHLLQHQG